MSADLVKVTVFLTRSAYDALERAADREGHTRTDVINRAVLSYERDPGLMAWFRFRIGRRSR